jgi:hypothetical protein
MCTVTFIPRHHRYYLGMNRDEKRTRPKGLPPAQRNIDGCLVVYPSEPGGGTWIALNERGASFALINWYSVPNRVKTNLVSRGEIIPCVGAASTVQMVGARLANLPLGRLNPFRLITIFNGTKQIAEWRWDTRKLVRRNHPWRAQQWISSGFDEPAAQEIRGKVFANAQAQESAGTLRWLRHLHRSHRPERGPFSICMHRDDAATVSYTEVCVFKKTRRMLHTCEPLCSNREARKHSWTMGQTGCLERFRLLRIRPGRGSCCV